MAACSEGVMLKMGIYFAYDEAASINDQGINQLVTLVTENLAESELNSVIIVCSRFQAEYLGQLLNNFGINLQRIQIITPAFIEKLKIRKYHDAIVKFGNKCVTLSKRVINKIFKIGKSFVIRVETIVLSGKTSSILHAVLLTLCFLILSPCAMVIVLISTVFKKLSRLADYMISRYEATHEKKILSLSEIANQQENVLVWYVPCLFWPEISEIKAKKIVVTPDTAFFEFPTLFASHEYFDAYEKMQASVKAADKLVCYSDYVKHQHFLPHFDVSPSSLVVIRHGWRDLSQYLSMDNELAKLAAIKTINTWLSDAVQEPWLKTFDIESVDYFVYSSQACPHKNLFNLVKAYEYLLRRKYINVKLILTAKIMDEELLQYIQDKRLQFDILMLYNLPIEVLAALNKRAVCAINPSYFESGFPFTFSEAYSVGTPSIMSDIPVVREVVTDTELAKTMLFDPTDYKNMADKMAWAFCNTQQLFDRQQFLAVQLQRRNGSCVAQEYIHVMKEMLADER